MALPRNESLVRAIGTFGLAAGIINITIGGGIFRLPANVAGSLGPAAPLAYLVCAVAMALIVFCIADAGSRVPLTGGPYAYVGTAFGPYVGFLSGVLLWMLGTFATAAVATVFASSLGLLVPPLAGRGMEIAILVAAFAAVVARQSARREPRGPAQLDRHGRQTAAAAAGRDWRRVLHRCRESADRGDARGGRRGADVAAADLRVRGDRMRAGAERGSPRHRAHRAARDCARDDRHHACSTSRCRWWRRACSAPGSRRRRCRRSPMSPARRWADGRGRCCSSAPRSRCSAISAA